MSHSESHLVRYGNPKCLTDEIVTDRRTDVQTYRQTLPLLDLLASPQVKPQMTSANYGSCPSVTSIAGGNLASYFDIMI